MENVDAPGGVDFSLGLGNVEKVSEGAGLDGERELVHDFDGVAGKCVVEEFVDEALDLGDDVGLPGAFEEGLDDLAIAGVFRWVGFDGELAHAS